MARTKITSPQLNPKVSVDSNGWTVYDYGSFKKYTKRYTGSAVTINVGATNVLVNAAALPTGMTSLSGKNMIYSVSMQYTYAFSVLHEAVLSTTHPQDATSLRFSAWNGGTINAGTGNWVIFVEITA